MDTKAHEKNTGTRTPANEALKGGLFTKTATLLEHS